MPLGSGLRPAQKAASSANQSELECRACVYSSGFNGFSHQLSDKYWLWSRREEDWPAEPPSTNSTERREEEGSEWRGENNSQFVIMRVAVFTDNSALIKGEKGMAFTDSLHKTTSNRYHWRRRINSFYNGASRWSVSSQRSLWYSVPTQ